MRERNSSAARDFEEVKTESYARLRNARATADYKHWMPYAAALVHAPSPVDTARKINRTRS